MARLRREQTNASLPKSEVSPKNDGATTSEFLFWMYQAMTPARSLRNKDVSRIFAKAGFFRTTDDPLQQHLVASAVARFLPHRYCKTVLEAEFGSGMRRGKCMHSPLSYPMVNSRRYQLTAGYCLKNKAQRRVCLYGFLREIVPP